MLLEIPTSVVGMPGSASSTGLNNSTMPTKMEDQDRREGFVASGGARFDVKKVSANAGRADGAATN
jgi:hypothetical protein